MNESLDIEPPSVGMQSSAPMERASALPFPTLEVSDAVLLPAESLEDRFERLRAECRAEVEAGRLEEALARAEEAVEIAERLGDGARAELARCNRGAVAIALGCFDDVADLRAILMRNREASTSFAAAYNLAHAYELRREFKKSLFYARIARDRAECSGDREFLAKSWNQIGLGLTGDSWFEEGLKACDRALELLDRSGADAELCTVSALARVNRAYCLVVLGERDEAFRDLFRCLRWYRRRGVHIGEVHPHLILCYAYLELGRLCRAWRHGCRALRLAEATGERQAQRHAHFLLAEIEKTAGDYDAAQRHLDRLWELTPDTAGRPTAPPAAAVVGLAQVVNLRA
ncbi:MAG: hypothetical protein AAGN46_12495 [Acidobacteriota bacterium]